MGIGSGSISATFAVRTPPMKRARLFRWVLGFAALGLPLTACTRGPEIPESAENAENAENAEATPPAHPRMPSDPHAGLVPPTGTRPAASSFDPAAPSLAGLRWATQEPLSYRPPTRPMRNAEYVVRSDAGEAVMTVFHFPGMGGPVRDNIDRWIGQFQTREGGPVADADVQSKTVNGFEVTTVDVRGVFAGGMGSPRVEDARMLGAIVVGPEGPVFFKLVGPEAAVSAAEGAFEALVDSFEPATDAG